MAITDLLLAFIAAVICIGFGVLRTQGAEIIRLLDQPVDEEPLVDGRPRDMDDIGP